MEWCVNLVKKHIKHMFGNKTMQNIKNRTAALSGIGEIAEIFDKTTKVIVRSKKHSVPSALNDEMTILEDLRQVRPFVAMPERYHVLFPHIPASMLQNVDVDKIHDWIKTKNICLLQSMETDSMVIIMIIHCVCLSILVSKSYPNILRVNACAVHVCLSQFQRLLSLLSNQALAAMIDRKHMAKDWVISITS